MTIQANDMKAILNGNAATLVDKAQDLGQALANELKTSQLRNIYGAVRQTQMQWDIDPQKAYNDVILLQPKLAYYTKRSTSLKPLKDALDLAIGIFREDKAPDQVHFKNFIDFCEAVVAYHRAFRRERD